MISTITITINHGDLPTSIEKELRPLLTAETLADPTSEAYRNLWGKLHTAAVGSYHAVSATVAHTKGWMAGRNRPGYPNVQAPELFMSWQDAMAYLSDELAVERHIAIAEQSSEASRHNARMDYDNAIRRFNQLIDHPDAVGKPTWVQCGSFVWWVAEEQA